MTMHKVIVIFVLSVGLVAGKASKGGVGKKNAAATIVSHAEKVAIFASEVTNTISAVYGDDPPDTIYKQIKPFNLYTKKPVDVINKVKLAKVLQGLGPAFGALGALFAAVGSVLSDPITEIKQAIDEAFIKIDAKMNLLRLDVKRLRDEARHIYLAQALSAVHEPLEILNAAVDAFKSLQSINTLNKLKQECHDNDPYKTVVKLKNQVNGRGAVSVAEAVKRDYNRPAFDAYYMTVTLAIIEAAALEVECSAILNDTQKETIYKSERLSRDMQEIQRKLRDYDKLLVTNFHKEDLQRTVFESIDRSEPLTQARRTYAALVAKYNWLHWAVIVHPRKVQRPSGPIDIHDKPLVEFHGDGVISAEGYFGTMEVDDKQYDNVVVVSWGLGTGGLDGVRATRKVLIKHRNNDTVKATERAKYLYDQVWHKNQSNLVTLMTVQGDYYPTTAHMLGVVHTIGFLDRMKFCTSVCRTCNEVYYYMFTTTCCRGMLPQDVYTVPNTIRLPFVEQYEVANEKEQSRDLVVEYKYLDSKGKTESWPGQEAYLSTIKRFDKLLPPKGKLTFGQCKE